MSDRFLAWLQWDVLWRGPSFLWPLGNRVSDLRHWMWVRRTR